MADAISKPTHRLFQDLTGRKFGRLSVTAYAGKRGHNHAWLCTCDCGASITALGSNLTRANTSSCGCLHREVTGNAHRTHGRTRTTEYNIHQSMLARCYDTGAISYPNYGGRGITVCERWRRGDDVRSGFECFLADMGDRPSRRHSVERSRNDGSYEPENCYWATKKEQSRNTRRNRRVVFRGKEMILEDAVRLSGLKHSTVTMRLHYGWSADEALTIPLGVLRGK